MSFLFVTFGLANLHVLSMASWKAKTEVFYLKTFFQSPRQNF